MSDYICDDRLDSLKLAEDIRNMTDEEFDIFQQQIKENGDFPKEYYLT